MNIIFNRIKAKNFRSIKEIELDLENQGVVTVKGINDSNMNASSNGSGKSSIFQAIIFALYGSLSNGDKNVQNKFVDTSYEVQLDFTIDGISYMIFRSSKESLLYKDNSNISARNKTDVDKQILSIIKINKDQFLDSIYLSNENDTSLCNLAPSARKERLEIIAGIDDIVESFKARIKEIQEDYENKSLLNKANIDKINGQKELLISQNMQNENKLIEINQKIEKELGEALSLDEINQKIESYNIELTNLNNEVQVNRDKIATIENERKTLNDKKDDFAKNSNEINTSIQNTRLNITSENSKILLIHTNRDNNIKKIGEINKEIENIKNSDHCPTCGRKYENFDMSQLDAKIQEKNNIIDSLNQENINKEKEVDEINKTISNLEITLKADEENLKINQDEINNLNTQIQSKDLEKANIDKTVSDLLANVNNINASINELSSKKDKLIENNYEQDKQNIQSQIEENNKKLIELDNDLKQEENTYNSNVNYNNVAKNMLQLITKDFRNYLLCNSINYLNNLLDKYSKTLFVNSTIKIDNSDNKLNIYVDDKLYDSLSSGEKIKVKVALMLAQKSLSESIGNFNCNVIVLDELLAACDILAEETIINLILNELNNLNSLYFISHKELQVPSDKTLIITKKNDNLSYLQ